MGDRVRSIRGLLHAPTEWVTDKCPAYGAALRGLNIQRAVHTQAKRANNRAESSHVPVRRREWKLQGFKSPGSAQRFLSMHAAIYNTFTVPRHLTTARTHRLLRAEAFATWREAAGVVDSEGQVADPILARPRNVTSPKHVPSAYKHSSFIVKLILGHDK